MQYDVMKKLYHCHELICSEKTTMNNHKILIVEDDEWITEFLSDTLTNHGYSVLDCVDSYEKALLSLNKNQPDLVILDIRLSGPGTGLDVAREINSRWKIPFIFLSSNIDPTLMPEILEESPLTILSKPCKPTDLIAAVQLSLSKGKTEITRGEDILSEDSFFVKSENAYHKIQLEDLLFIKGEGNYTKLQLSIERLVLRASLKDFEFLEQHRKLVRLHRSYIVNVDHIDKIHPKHIDIGNYEIPMTKEGKDELLKQISTIR